MKCLVTGAAGFIGSHLCQRLISEGHEVIGLDNFSVGRKENVLPIYNADKFEIHTVDIADKSTSINRYFKGVDWVFHLGARADVVPSIVDPYEYHRSNVDGTLNVLEACRKAEIKRFIYAASSSCYGIPDAYPTNEGADIRPQYPYAVTKYLGEYYVQSWNRIYGLPTVSLRLFNVYGPRARTNGTYGAVFGVFLAQLANFKPLTVVGDGTQCRDFTFVSDVVRAFIAAAESNLSGEILNVGSGGTYSINELLNIWGVDNVEYIPKRPGEPDMTFADTTRIRGLLNWQPLIPFEDGALVMKELMGQYKDAPIWDSKSIAVATEDWFKYLGVDA